MEKMWKLLGNSMERIKKYIKPEETIQSVSFKAGFMCCIESVEDFGDIEMAGKLMEILGKI